MEICVWPLTNQGSSQGVSSRLKEWCFKGTTSRLTINTKVKALNLSRADHQHQGSKLWTWAGIFLSEHSEISCSQPNFHQHNANIYFLTLKLSKITFIKISLSMRLFNYRKQNKIIFKKLPLTKEKKWSLAQHCEKYLYKYFHKSWKKLSVIL
jgi:hypothetical protein